MCRYFSNQISNCPRFVVFFLFSAVFFIFSNNFRFLFFTIFLLSDFLFLTFPNFLFFKFFQTFLQFPLAMIRNASEAIARQGEHGYQYPFLSHEEFRDLMARKTVRSNFGAGLVNLTTGGTVQSREKIDAVFYLGVDFCKKISSSFI